MTKTSHIAAAAFLAVLSLLSSCRKEELHVPGHVFPFYNGKPLAVNVGKDSECLTTDNPALLRKFSREVRAKADSVPVEELFILSIRLSDHDMNGLSAYWYLCARFRLKVLANAFVCGKGTCSDAFNKFSALFALESLAGEHVNEFLNKDKALWVRMARACKRDCSAMQVPDCLYPDLSRGECFDLDASVKAAAADIDDLIYKIENIFNNPLKEKSMDTYNKDSQYYADIVNKKLRGEISSMEFLEESPFYEEYIQWCKEHGEEPSETNAGLYIEMTENLAVRQQIV